MAEYCSFYMSLKRVASAMASASGGGGGGGGGGGAAMFGARTEQSTL